MKGLPCICSAPAPDESMPTSTGLLVRAMTLASVICARLWWSPSSIALNSSSPSLMSERPYHESIRTTQTWRKKHCIISGCPHRALASGVNLMKLRKDILPQVLSLLWSSCKGKIFFEIPRPQGASPSPMDPQKTAYDNDCILQGHNPSTSEKQLENWLPELPSERALQRWLAAALLILDQNPAAAHTNPQRDLSSSFFLLPFEISRAAVLHFRCLSYSSSNDPKPSETSKP